MYKACTPPTHFFRMKFRVDEVLRGSVEPFRVLNQSGPFGSSSRQFRTTFRVMNPSVDLFRETTTWHCQYDINFCVWGRSRAWILLLGVPGALPNPSQYEIGCHARRFHLLFSRAANESWLSVSRKHTTFNRALHQFSYISVFPMVRNHSPRRCRWRAPSGIFGTSSAKFCFLCFCAF